MATSETEPMSVIAQLADQVSSLTNTVSSLTSTVSSLAATVDSLRIETSEMRNKNADTKRPMSGNGCSTHALPEKRLPSLPLEIRLKIYRYCFTTPQILVITSLGIFSRSHLNALAQSSQEARNEAQKFGLD